MHFIDLTPEDRTDSLIRQLTQVWEASVRATHRFLPEPDLEEIAKEVPQALGTVPHLTVAWDRKTNAPKGFMGIAGHSLEMLFLHPDCMGQGLGGQLFRHGMARHYIAQITVNEQNERALAFYLKRGYKVHHRTPEDDQGRPYPILHLTLSCY